MGEETAQSEQMQEQQQETAPVLDQSTILKLSIVEIFEATAHRVLTAANEHASLNAQLQEEAQFLADCLKKEAERYSSLMQASTDMAKEIRDSMASEHNKIKSFTKKHLNETVDGTADNRPEN